MVNYCKTTGCLRNRLLDYFGQSAPSACGNCGGCRGAYVETDITTPAQMILSCVRRIRDKLGYYVGTALVARVLQGSGDRRIRELGLDELSTFGLLKEVPRRTINGYIDRLMELGYLFVEHTHTTLRPTQKASEVLFHGATVTILTRTDFQEEHSRRRVEVKQSGQTLAVDDGLLAALKAVRTRLAQQEEVPAYIIFSNAALADMASKTPRTIDQFLQVSGVGEVKAERYGSEFLRVISEYIERGNEDAGAEGIRLNRL